MTNQIFLSKATKQTAYEFAETVQILLDEVASAVEKYYCLSVPEINGRDFKADQGFFIQGEITILGHIVGHDFETLMRYKNAAKLHTINIETSLDPHNFGSIA